MVLLAERAHPVGYTFIKCILFLQTTGNAILQLDRAKPSESKWISLIIGERHKKTSLTQKLKGCQPNDAFFTFFPPLNPSALIHFDGFFQL